MHSKIKIKDPILVDAAGIKTLNYYIDVLKSTQVILCKRSFYSSKVEYESSTLDTNCNHSLLKFKSTYDCCSIIIPPYPVQKINKNIFKFI